MVDLSEFWGFMRFAVGLKPFLNHKVTTDEAKVLVRDWVNRREERLLDKIERAVFNFPRSPYLELFQMAGCDMGDVRDLVRSHGVEGALTELLNAGIYITWEELKGRRPAQRGSCCFDFREGDFHNPLNKPHYQTSTGGTSGAPARSGIDLEDHAESAPDWAVWFAAQGWIGRPLIFWTPTHTGMANRYLKCARFGAPYRKWFATSGMASLQDRFRSAMVHGLVQWVGGYPKPVPVPVDAPEKVSAYLLELVEQGHKPLVNTAPSLAARLSLDVLARGKSLDGVTFLLGAEPVTEARRRTIEGSGAVAAPTYGTSEGGWIGAQFPGTEEADEVHIFRDAYAVIARDQPDVPRGPETPLLFTNLRVASPKVLLNAEIGDSGVLVHGAGSEAAAELGYDVRIHTIRSFQKITAWGVTISVSDLYSVIETALPRSLGGTLHDYQLVEEQDEDGLSKLCLLVSPRVGEIGDKRIRETFLRELSRMRSIYGFMTDVVSQAGALRVERRDPIATARDKVLPVLPHRQR